jgi:hypothetical protein
LLKKIIRKDKKGRGCSLTGIFLEGVRKITRNFSRTQYLLNMVKVKVKQSHYRPGQAHRVPGG